MSCATGQPVCFAGTLLPCQVGASFANFVSVMASRERSWSEQIRDLIEEVDRVRGESERMRGQADRAMKSSFWPERRRAPRFPPRDDSHTDQHNDA
jgi:hypothetical protein